MLFKKKKKTAEVGRIVVDGADKLSHNEGYDRLRDNILYLNADGKNKVIQVESSVASEGKTTTVCNLAVSLGLTDKKVIIVDLDFRRPKTHRVFNLSKDCGIAEYILEDKPIDGIIKHTEFKNVDIITRGAEVYNSSLVFISEKFKKLVEELKEKYDFVFLDCAPILLVSDYIHVSKVSDGVLFIVAHAQTTRTQVSEAVKELKKNDINILGAVFSKYDKKKVKYYVVGDGIYSSYSYRKYQYDTQSDDE